MDADDLWAPAVTRALVGMYRYADPDRWEDMTAAITSPHWVPGRPPRKMPSLWEIASYWEKRGEHFAVRAGTPHCFACGSEPPCRSGTPEQRWNGTGRRLERSHLVNWARNGLDQSQNLVPLCVFCNRMMPVFDIEHADDAIAWVQAGGAVAELEERIEAAELRGSGQVLPRLSGSALERGEVLRVPGQR